MREDDIEASVEEQAKAALGSANVPDFYVNQVGIALSAYDLTLTWGRRGPAGHLEALVRTTMSQEHAVTLHVLLGRLLRDYYRENDMRPALANKLLQDFEIRPEELPW